MTHPRHTFLTVLVAVATCALAAASAAPSADPDGKQLVLQYRCNSCHTIQAMAIEKKADPADEKEKSDKKSPDLSGVGKKRTAAWIGRYMQKLEMIEGERHRKKFRGTEAELKTISEWLATLKSDVKAKGK